MVFGSHICMALMFVSHKVKSIRARNPDGQQPKIKNYYKKALFSMNFPH